MVQAKGIARNRYINEAVDFYNRFQHRKKLATEFQKASEITKNSSLEINEEFDRLIDEGAI